MGNALTVDDSSCYELGRSAAEQQSATSLSCTYSKNGNTIAHFFFTESPREEAANSIEVLNSSLQSPCMILSGDDTQRVSKVAKKLHIPEYFGDLLPEQKQAKIEEIEQSLRVLYLGDGVNDLPALQSASLSGAPFANINMLTADVDFLFTDETMGFLPRLIQIAKQRRRRKLILIVYTLLYNVIVLAVCIAGLMSPLYAAIIMPLSSLISIGLVSKPFNAKAS